MRLADLSYAALMIRSARAAARCREAARETKDLGTADALYRAAHRYSQQVAETADEMLREAGWR